MKLLTIAGLVFDLLGAVVIAAGVIASRAHIRCVSAVIAGFNPAEVEDRRRQSNLALSGLILLIVGFALQIAGALLG